MECFSKELSYRLNFNNFLRCACKEHDYEIWECRWVKKEYFKCLDHFDSDLFWLALKKKDYKFLAFLTKSENLFLDSLVEVKENYKIEVNGIPEHPSYIWDSDESKDYSDIFNWYYRMKINIVFVDCNTNLKECDPKYLEFLTKNKFPFISEIN